MLSVVMLGLELELELELGSELGRLVKVLVAEPLAFGSDG